MSATETTTNNLKMNTSNPKGLRVRTSVKRLLAASAVTLGLLATTAAPASASHRQWLQVVVTAEVDATGAGEVGVASTFQATFDGITKPLLSTPQR